MHGPAYWAPGVAPCDAPGNPVFAPIQPGGPWSYWSHPAGGTLAVWSDAASHTPEGYRAPEDIGGGLHYCGPLELPHLHDLARPVTGGTDVRLACGLTITVPVALVEHRQLRLGNRGPRVGAPVTEYGRLAAMLRDRAAAEGGVPSDDADLLRLLTLAVAQCYRVTADLLDDLGVLAASDTDSLLGAIWCGDPKALATASAGGANASPASGSTVAP